MIMIISVMIILDIMFKMTIKEMIIIIITTICLIIMTTQLIMMVMIPTITIILVITIKRIITTIMAIKIYIYNDNTMITMLSSLSQ